MTRRLRLGRLAAVAALAATMLSGCIFVDHQAPADLTFQWSFSGRDCGWAGVDSVVVQVWEDPATVNEIRVSCYDYGATLIDFAPDRSYHYDLLGLTVGGQVIYEGSGDFYAYEGENVVNVDLWPVY